MFIQVFENIVNYVNAKQWNHNKSLQSCDLYVFDLGFFKDFTKVFEFDFVVVVIARASHFFFLHFLFYLFPTKTTRQRWAPGSDNTSRRFKKYTPEMTHLINLKLYRSICVCDWS